MAVGTLLGVETVGRDAKHVVALNANPMNHAGAARQCGIFGGVRRGRGMLSHALILAQSPGRLARPLGEHRQYASHNLFHLNRS